MYMTLDRDVVLITGGLGTVGTMFIDILLDNGYNVVTTTHNKDNIGKLNKPNLHYLYCDFSDEDWVDKVTSWCNNNPQLIIKYLINNVRDKTNLITKGDVTTKQWLNEFNLSTIVPYKLTMLLKNTLISVVNINSIYGLVVPNKNMYKDKKSIPPLHYGVCKSSTLKLTVEMAVRLLEYGISINSLVLGGFYEKTPLEISKQYELICPNGKMLTKEDLVTPLLFLLGQTNNSFTGKEITIDGGWTLI